MKEPFAQVEKRLPQVNYGLIWQVITAVVGFLAARTPLLSDHAPFGVAMVAGAPLQYSPAAAVGAAFGYFLPVTDTSGFRYLAAVVFLSMIKFLIPFLGPQNATYIGFCFTEGNVIEGTPIL